MIDRKILNQIGFVNAGPDNGWDHEVWVYDGDFWVHFGGDFSGLPGRQISGDDGMQEFFKMFIANIECNVRDRATVIF